MNVTQILSCVAVSAALCVSTQLARAAAPVGIETETNAIEATSSEMMPVTVHQLGTEMVVHNWVLCVSRDFAEQLVHAREEGASQARATYAELAGNRSCGQIDSLLLILRERLYASPIGSGHDARVFSAEVKLADNWATAFVVYGGLPDD